MARIVIVTEWWWSFANSKRQLQTKVQGLNMSVDPRDNSLFLDKQMGTDLTTGFALISHAGMLAKWWGPRGITLGSHQLDLGNPGSWHSVMIGEDGGWHKVSGKVLRVKDSPGCKTIEFSWAWHDRVSEERGHESHVQLEVRQDKNGPVLLTLRQTGLADLASARLHAEGWESSLSRIDDVLASCV